MWVEVPDGQGPPGRSGLALVCPRRVLGKATEKMPAHLQFWGVLSSPGVPLHNYPNKMLIAAANELLVLN